MIETPVQYEKAQEELRLMGEWLARLHREETGGDGRGGGGGKGLTKASVRKMIARLHEELAAYEGAGGGGGQPIRPPPGAPA